MVGNNRSTSIITDTIALFDDDDESNDESNDESHDAKSNGTIRNALYDASKINDWNATRFIINKHSCFIFIYTYK